MSDTAMHPLCLCGRCGSRSVTEGRTNWVLAFLHRIRGLRVIRCRRCGWDGAVRPSVGRGDRGRRRRRQVQTRVPGLETPPDLTALDTDMSAGQVNTGTRMQALRP